MSELQNTVDWFKQAIPEPTDKQKCIQIGCHFEEVSEMLESIGDGGQYLIEDIATSYKSSYECDVNNLASMDNFDKERLLDSLVDQIVTATGVAHMMGFDLLGALAEVNRSNFSKFEDGKPVFDAHGKITKGKDYTPPNLTVMIGE